MSLVRSVPLGCGSYLPERVMSNDDLAMYLDTSDEWIRTRTGIETRHIVAEDETTSDMALAAALDALASARIDAQEIDLVVLATTTPDRTFPATATRVQSALGIRKGCAFDLQAVCSGFLFALVTADSMLQAGRARTALVLGAEAFSRILDWKDRSTAVLFGDGAGALVLQAQEVSDTNGPGLLSSCLRSDGDLDSILYVDGGIATGDIGHVRMEGREVFRHAVRNLAEVAREVIEEAKVDIEDIDWLVPHQANMRIIESTARNLGLPRERVVVTIANHGNTSAASVPLALDSAVRDGRIKRGDLILTQAIGGGLSWGAALMRW